MDALSTRLYNSSSGAAELPSAPGTYALILRLAEPWHSVVGSLGKCNLAPGAYLYVGSAHGAGGLRARVLRHLRAEKPMHWHIDHLTAYALTDGVIWNGSGLRHECQWVHRLLAIPGAYAPILGFGSSDCTAHCPAHLVALLDVNDLTREWTALFG